MRILPSRYTLTIPVAGDRLLAYNTSSQCFALWNAEEIECWDCIESGETTVADKGWQDIVKNKYAVIEGFDEFAALEQEYEANRQQNHSLQITVCTTLYCNFGCSYCFQGLEKPTQKMSAKVRDAIVAYAEATLPDRGHLGLCWYGGEPLMGQHALFDLAERLATVASDKRASRSAFIVTNGYLLNAEIAQKLVDAGVGTAQITIDGPQELHDQRRPLLSGRGSYQQILDNIADVTANTALRIVIRVNTDLENRGEIELMLLDLAERGFSRQKGVSVYFAPVEATTVDCSGCETSNLQKEEFAKAEMELIELARAHNLASVGPGGKFLGLCQAIRPRSIVVTPSGDVHKCWETVNQPELRHGTIFEMAEAERSAVSQRWLAFTPFDNEVCRQCKILPMCAGACAFKTVHSDQQSGEAALPCPSWKFNIAEKMFLRAVQQGVVSREDWIDGVSNTTRAGRRITGDRQTTGSVANAARKIETRRLPVQA